MQLWLTSQASSYSSVVMTWLVREDNVCTHGWSHVSSPRGLHPLHPHWPLPTVPSGTLFQAEVSICSLVYYSECVRMHRAVLSARNRAAVFQYYTCKHSDGLIYWSQPLSPGRSSEPGCTCFTTHCHSFCWFIPTGEQIRETAMETVFLSACIKSYRCVSGSL